ncbi:hypothetical protein WAF17_17805 [Bernardetia sp. ABR2-2B]|uniref:hypothetical protein n=1 Tax=Bernardetia sp. ABR2-2B TaxID=3127472 RepID=UPI0030D59D12
MNIKHLIFALFTAATLSSLVSCDESTPQPTPEPCVSCENETVVDSLFDVEAIVRLYKPEDEMTDYSGIYIIDLQKKYFDKEYTSYGSDSIFIPCPKITDSSLDGKKVIVKGYVKSCDSLLTHPNIRVLFGRKLDLVKIEKY